MGGKGLVLLYEDAPGVYVAGEVFGADDDGVPAWVEGSDFEGEIFLFRIEDAVERGELFPLIGVEGILDVDDG